MFEPIDSAVLHDSSLNWSEAEELSGYRTMLLIRRFEEKAAQLYAMGHLEDLAPLAIGREAVAAGLVRSAAAMDAVIAGWRTNSLMLAQGVSAVRLMSHLFGVRGLAAGPVEAPGVAPPLPLVATGEKHGSHAATIWCIENGDDEILRATIEPASLDRLPIVFILTNSAMEPSGWDPCRNKPSALYQRCNNAGINSAVVNGIDIRHVKAAADDALRGARADRGVSVLEVMTCGYRGHALPAGQVSRLERPRHETCPVAKARARIVASGGPGAEALVKDLEQSVRAEINAAAEAARTAASSAA